MKAKCLITVLTFLFTIITGFAQRVHCPECPFEPGEQVYVFGNDVKLRAEPNTDSKVLELLKIGEWVKIIEQTESSWPYKGFDSPFYKVKYDDMTGYILGGLLSLEKKTVGGTNFFFAYSKEREKFFLNIRNMRFGELLEKKIPLTSAAIGIKTYGNRDIEYLDGIFYIDYSSEEYDGQDYGGIYVFAFEGALSAYELSRSHDIEASYASEKFVFPDEEGGIPGKIIFKKEKGHDFLGGEYEWLHTVVETWKLSWYGGELVPDFRGKSPN